MSPTESSSAFPPAKAASAPPRRCQPANRPGHVFVFMFGKDDAPRVKVKNRSLLLISLFLSGSQFSRLFRFLIVFFPASFPVAAVPSVSRRAVHCYRILLLLWQGPTRRQGDAERCSSFCPGLLASHIARPVADVVVFPLARVPAAEKEHTATGFFTLPILGALKT